MYNLNGRQIVKFPHSAVLTSHFENFWSMVQYLILFLFYRSSLHDLSLCNPISGLIESNPNWISVTSLSDPQSFVYILLLAFWSHHWCGCNYCQFLQPEIHGFDPPGSLYCVESITLSWIFLHFLSFEQVSCAQCGNCRIFLPLILKSILAKSLKIGIFTVLEALNFDL